MRHYLPNQGHRMRAGGNGVRVTRERRRAMRSGVALTAQFLMTPEALFPVSLDKPDNMVGLD
jgi:hypothetical protein